MKTLVPKYSDGSRWIVPFVCDDIFLTFQFVPPNTTSVLKRRSPTHHDPHSTGAYLSPGNWSNLPASSSCHSVRCVQNATSSMNWAMLSLYESMSASPEWVCTTRPASAQAAHTGS